MLRIQIKLHQSDGQRLSFRFPDCQEIQNDRTAPVALAPLQYAADWIPPYEAFYQALS